MISDYFEFLKTIAKNNSNTVKFRLIREFIGVNHGYIRFILELRDYSELHVFEFVDSDLHKTDYSYHWQDKNNKIILRWDNAAHHHEIETFPHHLHEGDNIRPSVEPNFVEILKKIGEQVH